MYKIEAMNLKRPKLFRGIITACTVLMITAFLATFLLQTTKDDIFCDTFYHLIFGMFALVLQIFINVVSWKSDNKLLLIAALFISTGLTGGMIMKFFGFAGECL